MITGGVLSTTVTVAVQVGQVEGTASGSHAEFSAVNVTVYVPGPTIVPAFGDWLTVTEQPVVWTSLIMFGIDASQLAFTEMVLFEAHDVIVGGAGAITVTWKLQLGP